MDERDSRGDGEGEGEEYPSKLIRGREKGVSTGCSGDREVGRVKRREAHRRYRRRRRTG